MRARFGRCSAVVVLGLVALGTVPLTATAESQQYWLTEVAAGPDVKESPGAVAPENSQVRPLVPHAAKGMALFAETEPNDTAATANALAGTEAVVYGTINPATEVDYFSFTASAGDRVSAATMTSFSNGGSTDTIVDIIDSDGVTVLETDDDSGSYSSLSSAISGTVIPANGTYYVRVDGYSGTSLITPYHLHVRVLSGAPTAEVEPNNDLGTATPLAASGWASGTITATTDPDIFSFELNAGDSVYITLDMDPDRDPTNASWNGRAGLGVLNNFFLLANDGSTTKPNAEAFFMTVVNAGTYYAYVDSAVATGLGDSARYHLSVRVIPKRVQTDCTVIASSDVPVTIGPDVGTVTSTIVVPGTVTSSINDLKVALDLTHANMPDLDVTLASPAATSVPLFTDIGSSTQVDMNLWLDDDAALPIGNFTVVKDIVFQPEQPGRLSSFDGEAAAGTWTLSLADDTNTLGGTLNGWSLEICGAPAGVPSISLVKTVGTDLDPLVCAPGDAIAVAAGTDVSYCYTVTNTGDVPLAYHDLDDDMLGNIFTGLNYPLMPGANVFVTQTATINTTTVNTATWTAYNLGGPSAQAMATATVTVVGAPDIDVSPLALSATQPPGTTTGQVLTIANTGASDLTWAVVEDVRARAVRVDWSDNFDSYATGSQMHGQGGWKGWANAPGAGALTSSVQSLSAPNSVDILGASDLVHEYAETDGVWTYTAWQFIPTDFTGISYFILLNQYDDAGTTNNWSTQVNFDSATDLVTNDGPAGGTLPLVRNAWVEIRVVIDLVADTQEFYYGGALLFSGSWSDGQSGGGITSIGAIDLFANNASSVFYDDISLVEHTVGCSAVTNIPWLSSSATAGTTPPAGSTPVDVFYNSTGLAPGAYLANLCVTSNDPDPGPGNGTDLVIVPVELTVEGELDWGDAPDPTFPTLAASNGARHVISAVALVALGNLVDAELDGQPTANADGDDLNNLADEDGVVFTSPIEPGQNTTVDVTATVPLLLDAWMDFNDDGDWNDPGEQIFTNQPLAAGLNNLAFPVPPTAIPFAGIYARFRASSAGGLTPEGLAPDGEVEDYFVTTVPVSLQSFTIE